MSTWYGFYANIYAQSSNLSSLILGISSSLKSGRIEEAAGNFRQILKLRFWCVTVIGKIGFSFMCSMTSPHFLSHSQERHFEFWHLSWQKRQENRIAQRSFLLTLVWSWTLNSIHVRKSHQPSRSGHVGKVNKCHFSFSVSPINHIFCSVIPLI